MSATRSIKEEDISHCSQKKKKKKLSYQWLSYKKVSNYNSSISQYSIYTLPWLQMNAYKELRLHIFAQIKYFVHADMHVRNKTESI